MMQKDAHAGTDLCGSHPHSGSPRRRWITCHTHTNLSLCGRPEMTLEAILERATALGYGLVALTDHIHVPEVTDHAAHRQRLLQYQARRDEEDLDLDVLVGAEFEVAAPGRVIAPPALVDVCECAVVAPNHYQLAWVDSPPADPRQAAAHELACIQTALDWPRTQAVVHPFKEVGLGLTAGALYGACDRAHLTALIQQAAARRIAFEIQPKYWREPGAAPLAEFFDQVLAAGGRVSLGSDAHALQGLTAWAADLPAVHARFHLDDTNCWRPVPPPAAQEQVSGAAPGAGPAATTRGGPCEEKMP